MKNSTNYFFLPPPLPLQAISNTSFLRSFSMITKLLFYTFLNRVYHTVLVVLLTSRSRESVCKLVQNMFKIIVRRIDVKAIDRQYFIDTLGNINAIWDGF